MLDYLYQISGLRGRGHQPDIFTALFLVRECNTENYKITYYFTFFYKTEKHSLQIWPIPLWENWRTRAYQPL